MVVVNVDRMTEGVNGGMGFFHPSKTFSLDVPIPPPVIFVQIHPVGDAPVHEIGDGLAVCEKRDALPAKCPPPRIEGGNGSVKFQEVGVVAQERIDDEIGPALVKPRSTAARHNGFVPRIVIHAVNRLESWRSDATGRILPDITAIMVGFSRRVISSVIRPKAATSGIRPQ